MTHVLKLQFDGACTAYGRVYRLSHETLTGFVPAASVEQDPLAHYTALRFSQHTAAVTRWKGFNNYTTEQYNATGAAAVALWVCCSSLGTVYRTV